MNTISATNELRQSEFPLKIYTAEFSSDMNTHIRWHWHDEMEFIYINKGTAVFSIAENGLILKEGQGIFINSTTLHSSMPYQNSYCLYHSIVFSPSVIFGEHDSAMSKQYLYPISHSEDLRYLIFDSNDVKHQPILECLEMLSSLNASDTFCFELECKLHLTKLWIHLLKQLNEQIAPHTVYSSKQTLDEIRAKEAISYIENHYTEPITLEDIAASIHLSNSECCRCFKRCIHLTPFEYLMRYRVYITTCLMVEDSISSVSTIASSVGFNSSSYFNKLFRKYMGCTPTQFRKAPLKYDFSKAHFMIPF